MRTRIALTTAVAVTTVAIPAVLMSLFNSNPAWAQATRHEAVSSHQGADTHQPVRISDTLMSYTQAQKVAQMVNYANAVEAAQQATFYKDLVFLQDLAFFQAVAAQQQTIPAAWMPTAVCEEGGRNDSYAGYFGILEWHHFGGYPTAGSAPLSVQLAWEAAHGQGPPDAPGECHGY
ncbi:MAG TPA: hypothetical protein VH012_09845 [Acidimicrobiales bacterium]|nr:hypothetical protein [Acidimicrobiales bacterium]